MNYTKTDFIGFLREMASFNLLDSMRIIRMEAFKYRLPVYNTKYEMRKKKQEYVLICYKHR